MKYVYSLIILALHLIVIMGDPSSVNLLLNSGADINSRDNEGQVCSQTKKKDSISLFLFSSFLLIADSNNQSMNKLMNESNQWIQWTNECYMKCLFL
jgi:ankyrin repeat protein